MRKRATHTGISIAEKLLLSADETAGMLGLGRDTVYKMAIKNTIMTVKVGNRRLYPRIAVEQYVARLCREQGAEVEG
ncbi:MAG: helix-turn-helix domain-containing protein [Ktedonobacterales bacterium]